VVSRKWQVAFWANFAQNATVGNLIDVTKDFSETTFVMLGFLDV
jgi:hypothetical protein